jgi:hypothetical protein
VHLASLLPAVVVVAVGVHLLGLGVTALLAPSRAAGYLLAFAGTRRLHALELLARLLAGAGLVLHAPHMRFAAVFGAFGWVLVGTTVALALLPWRWHRRFARRSVPAALGFLPLIGAASVLGGGFLLWAVAAGPGG